MKKVFNYAIIALGAYIAGVITMQVINPSHDAIIGESYKDISDARLEMIAAQDALLHQVFTDNEDYWYDVLVEGDAYHTLDSIRGGDWEDFYEY